MISAVTPDIPYCCPPMHGTAIDLLGPQMIGDVMADHVENDLANLKGIGPKYAEMLKSIGVDSIKELKHRNPASLKEMIETRHGKVVGLSEKECATWIDEAKATSS
jgi:predicted flap endonuclease-1-like 5' DNA nuclease